MINRRIVILTNGFNSASGGRRLFSKTFKIFEKNRFFFSVSAVQPTFLSYFSKNGRSRRPRVFPIHPILTPATPMARRSSQRRFAVSLDDAELTFNAAHFVAFPLAVPGPDGGAFSFDAATQQVVRINNDDVLATAAVRSASEPAWFGEPIHGHDFRVSIRVEGPRDASGCVLDFVAARRSLLEVAAAWNHRTILATRAPETEYREIPPTPDNPVGEVVVLWRGAPEPRRWVVPLDAVAWIDALNASTEELASVLLDYWLEKIVEIGALPFPTSEYRFTLRLEESPGAFAEVALG